MAENLMREGNMPSRNSHLKNNWYKTLFPVEFENTEANVAWIQRASEHTASNRRYVYSAPNRIVDAATLPMGSGPAIICASGSSLNDVAPRLKEFKGAVFCTQSQARTLVYHGRPPDYVVTVDARRGGCCWDVPDPAVWQDTVYLAHPGVHPDLFQSWPSTIGLFRILDPESLWYSRILPVLFPGVKARLVPYADSMAAMLAFASALGYNPIFMAGCDYAGDRFAEWRYECPERTVHGSQYSAAPAHIHTIDGKLYTQGEWKFNPAKNTANHGVIAAESGLETDFVSIHSKRGVLITAYAPMFSGGMGTAIYQMSSKSIITEFPHVPFERVLADDVPPWTEKMREDTMRAIERMLARNDTFVIPVHNGARQGINVVIAESYDALVHQAFATWQEVVVNKQYLKMIEAQNGMSMSEMQVKKPNGFEQYELDELSPGPHEWATFDSDKISTPEPGEFITHALELWKEAGREIKSDRPWPKVLEELYEKQRVDLLAQAGLVEQQLEKFRGATHGNP